MGDILNNLSKEALQEIILKISKYLSAEQYETLENLIEQMGAGGAEAAKPPGAMRMSQEFVDEKMVKVKEWMRQIDEGELYLDTEEYEDYSDGYWDPDWITEYYDNQRIGEKILSMIQFAKDCVDDRRYQEAGFIYEWLWGCIVLTDEEYLDPVDLEMLENEEIISADMERLALLTLYAVYQITETENRAELLYEYFKYYTFHTLHMEDMLYAGREKLPDIEQFWKDWIALLKTKSGDVEIRLLKEAVLYSQGVEGLVHMADENCSTHPSLYLEAMKEYDKNHDYEKIEEIGKRAIEKLDGSQKARSEAALKAACASSCLMHEENMMVFCWECFRSSPTERNLLRLFGTGEMAEKYGLRVTKIFCEASEAEALEAVRLGRLCPNEMGDTGYYTLCFYAGDFKTVKKESKNPKGSLGWSTRFIRKGLRLILLYLYQKPLPSKAAASIAGCVGFRDHADTCCELEFERKIADEGRENQTSLFWNYFQCWKAYFPMDQEEKKQYLHWAEKIAHSRADALVSAQHRQHYYEAAMLLAMTAEIKEDMGAAGEMQRVFAEYKKKFPRHSAFQAEMRGYFGI